MNKALPTVVVSSGEPAGIGPDLCLMTAQHTWQARVVVVGDIDLLRQRATRLRISTTFTAIASIDDAVEHTPGTCQVLHVPVNAECMAGVLNPGNSEYVLRLLNLCAALCMSREADAMVTAPVHKAIINDAGYAFSGHTEFLAELTGTPLPVMLLCADKLRVALVTTHLPLSQVSAAITPQRLNRTLHVLRTGLIQQFGLSQPRISVCGLNPHAGEGGHLGREEIEIIEPTLALLRNQRGWILHGPLPADTVFTPRHLRDCDAVLAMYHDQGLPTLKYAGFGSAVNVTLGLPIIRTSVDHGTALDLAGTGRCDSGSMEVAMKLAIDCVTDQATNQ